MTKQDTTFFSTGQQINQANSLCLDLTAAGMVACELDGPANKPLYLAHHTYQDLYSDPPALLAEGIKACHVRPKQYGKTYINYSGRQFTLVPSAFFSEADARALLAFNCGDTGDDVILYDDINPEIKLIYSIHERLKSAIDKLFPNHHLKHSATVMAKLAMQGDDLAKEQVLLAIDDASVLIIARQQQQLLLCNQYQVQTDEDILYYLLFALEQFGLSPMTVKVAIAGNIETDSALVKALKKYIRHVRFAGGSRLINREAIPTLPHHFYYSTLNRLLCES